MNKESLPKPTFAILVLLGGLFGVVWAFRLASPASTSPTQAPGNPTPTVSPAPLPTRPPGDPLTIAIPLVAAAPTPTVEATQPPIQEIEPSPTALLEGHFIQEIRGHRQYFPLGCETAAARDWANYFGFDFNEFEFQYRLPSSDNPDFGFVGDVNSAWGQVPPYAYGVYAGPIADLLTAYGIPAQAEKGYTLERVKAQLDAEKPVIVWVIGNMEGGIPAEYTDSEGRKTVVAAFEHAVVLTGYGPETIRYMNNGKFYDVPTEVFLNSWSVLGNMAIIQG